MGEFERAEDAHGVGVAAAGGDDHLNTGGVGGEQGGEVAGGDLAGVTEEGAVHVEGYQTGCGGAWRGLWRRNQCSTPPLM